MTNNNKQQQIIDFLSRSIGEDLVDNLANYCLQNSWENSELLQNFFTGYFDELTDEAFCYYDHAIEYLRENDPSLQNSIEIASLDGYDLKTINSCVLANILHQNERRIDELCKINFEELFKLINQ